MRTVAGVGLVAAALLVTTAASAADLPRAYQKAPPAAEYQVWSWTGINIGATVGMRSNIDEGSITSATGAGAAGIGLTPAFLATGWRPPSHNDTTFRGSLFIGYDYQIAPSWVIGIEADIGFADQSLSQFVAATTVTSTVEEGWDSSIRGRVGYLLTPYMLLYATGGVSWLDWKGTVTCPGVPFSPCVATGLSAASNSDTLTGYTIGGGIDVRFWQNWYARAEYRYADYGSTTRTSTIVTGAGPVTVSGPVSTETHTAMFGAYYKFNWN